MWRILLIACLGGALSGPWAEAAVPVADGPETRRLALVIGNSDYAGAPLASPVNDAKAMARTLRAAGFEVIDRQNATRQEMLEAIQEFDRHLDAGGVGLFYFAGHGVRVADHTLLLPVEADNRFPARFLAVGIDVASVLAGMSGPRPGQVNLVILDTCLDNPLPSPPGAAPVLPAQTLLAYATRPGAAAGEGENHGFYTAALLQAMAEPGRTVEEVFALAGAEVRRASRQKQAPQLFSSLPAGFRLLAAGSAAPPQPMALAGDTWDDARTRGILPKDSAEQYELTFWESIKDSTFPSDYEAYLQAYPKGRFATLAQARLERLRAAAPKTETPSPPAAAKTAPERPAAPRAAPEHRHPTPAAKAATEPAGPTASVPAAATTPAKAAADTRGVSEVTDCPTCPQLVILPRGAFTMGSNTDDPSERPAHRVSIAESFAIGKYEVTAEQWNACTAAGACPRIETIANVPGNSPASDISWDNAQVYVKWLSKLTGKAYRLPSEAEWEYAARGGTATRYWWGEQMRQGNANCKGCGDPWRQEAPAKSGSFAANPYGLHDVNGSVWEWVADCWHSSYRSAPTDGRAWTEQHCQVRVIRGGSWRDGPGYMMSSTRFKYDASVREFQNGFRVARDNK
ncbi:SUMF1/EgtB/PvdO family nonheme iron enzyme [Dechloromonas sp. XY25]|uniref:SUMF1/EgtB/PvdO family nonheme iron enzyme n=1 Tax=Dechloromonas hankyongensis TaxID=2908002 RepID=A0ABS9K7M8_9RHOO|nr:SUMF1/EgtB/PvdO family nonheme iron enzyme [Dechloromonas hankyongensis]MCG2579168.1 SUMF1/EgtB/PvdO family nonheme iron enzyme [Dechloromonas hankyongensis]